MQRFAIGKTKYNNIGKVAPLIEKYSKVADFTDKRESLTYWLKQYVSLYDDKNFTEEELQEYLYDDIVRQAGPSKDEMSAQELLTTTAGLKRITTKKQAFPQHEAVHFYRTMDITELRTLLGLAPDDPLPNEGDDVKDQVTNPRALAGGHLGDYKQAISYFKGSARGGGQALVQFTVDSSNFFSPSHLAIPTARTDFGDALKSSFKGDYAPSRPAQGTHDEMPGLKSEQRGVYSVGLTGGGADAFFRQVTAVTVMKIKVA